MYTTFANILLMAGANGKGGSSFSLIFLGGMILVMWLFMIRPQAKKAKQQKEFNNRIQKGDKIVTIAGIHGRINRVNDDGTLQLEVAPGTFMIIERSAISLEYTTAMEKKNAPAAVEPAKK